MEQEASTDFEIGSLIKGLSMDFAQQLLSQLFSKLFPQQSGATPIGVALFELFDYFHSQVSIIHK
ncbi:hypothetical protein [Paenibacillus sp. GCM10012306]|uniref:hypothetical protein n=1 Tax=Paenibacillus sp. GCM10012306 TaxID=3317342 RepID=UPI003613C90D